MAYSGALLSSGGIMEFRGVRGSGGRACLLTVVDDGRKKKINDSIFFDRRCYSALGIVWRSY